ncbi:hypothetical protein CaCOL14_007934 [Colletotrichum acutatum]
MRGIQLYISGCTSQPHSRGGKSHLAGRYAKSRNLVQMLRTDTD